MLAHQPITDPSGSHDAFVRFSGYLTLPPEQAVDYIVDECFLATGQAMARRKELAPDAAVWWRDHYRARFLEAMRRFGNRWSRDRATVKAVARLLADRAVRHAGAAPAIDRACAMKAAADVERLCTLHAMRELRRAGREKTADTRAWIAGYWCSDGIPI